jgi:ribose 5-phosphate isomerase A
MVWAMDSAEDDPAAPLKRQAALRAFDHVRDGMVLGLGSGSTAAFFVAELGRRVAAGLRVVGIPTSHDAEQLASRYGVPLTDLSSRQNVDLTVDGADEIELGTLNLTKGRGGALVREKLVAHASTREIIIADASKLVAHLGERSPVPVAVVQFGWERTARELEGLGCRAARREAVDGRPFVSDDGLFVLDCRFPPIANPEPLANALKGIIGVVDHGLFLHMADQAIVAAADGVQLLERAGR